MTPETQELLAALSERWGLTKSATIAEALRRAKENDGG